MKYAKCYAAETWDESLPSRERGLKSGCLQGTLERSIVAPLAGAWIEIPLLSCGGIYIWVAPLAGAWIEIATAGALSMGGGLSLPSRERGLKYNYDRTETITETSRSPRGSVD